MSDTPRIKRIEDLRRRADSDPASLVFAALAEEYRRAGRLEEAIATCRAGLEHHPAFLSARVTLGRALIEVGELEEAKDVLKHVVNAAPENLAAIRALAEIHSRQGALDEEKVYTAMAQFVVAEPGLHEAPHRPPTAAPATEPVGVAAAEPVKPPIQSDSPVVVAEPGFYEAPHAPTTDATAAEPVRVVVAEPGFYEAPHQPTTAPPATTPVGVAAAEPVRPPTPSLPPVVSSVDTDALRSLDGFLVAVLVARAQRERASLS